MLIDQEIENIAEKMEKGTAMTEFSIDLIKSTIKELGAEDLKKAAVILNEDQKALLKSILEDMKKASNDLEPASKTTPVGDETENENKPTQTEHDEYLADEAKKRKQMEHKNQGGNNPPEGWEGQVIKAAPMTKKEEAKTLISMEEKEHGTKDPKKLIEAEKKENTDCAHGMDMKKCSTCMAKSEDDMEKGGSGSGRKPINPALAGVESVKTMQTLAEEAQKIQANFKEAPKPKHEHEEETPAMSLDEKKKVAKTNLKKMMKRMQERSMEKSACIAILAKNLEVDGDKLSAVWDALAKSDVLPEKGNPEGAQSSVPSQMKGDGSGAVHDPEEADVPAYKDKKAKKPSTEAKPESGAAAQTADAAMAKVPSTMGHKGDMKKSFWHEEAAVYEGKQDIFKSNKFGKNAHYSVDSYIEAEADAQKARLSKSTFDYSDDETPAPKAKKMKKGEDPAMQAVVDANQKKQNQAERDAKDEIKDIKIQEKLTRIEGKGGPKMPMLKGKLKKSAVEVFIEKKLDMDSTTLETAENIKSSEAQGAFLVKSFSDVEMDALFQSPDMWKKEEK